MNLQESIKKILKEEVFESDESRQERKFTKLLNNIEEYINSNSYNSVVRVMVDYDEVMDDVIVNIFFDAEHAVKLGGGINSVIKRTGKKIMEDLSVFPFDFKYHIHFEKPQLNESLIKENKDHTKLIKGIIDSSDIFDYKHFCGFDIITPEERSDQYNFLNKDRIPYLIKVYFVGGPNSEVWPRTQAIRNKELDLMEELHEYIKSFVPFNIEMMGSHVNSCDGYKKLMKRKYTTDDLQESIRKVLREEDYSPAGKEIIPNSIIVHKSNPMFRDKIMEQGLKVRAGECYKVYVGYGVKCKPAIFATNSTNKRAWFDSTYDDDIWFIDTRMIPDVKWYKDRHYESRSKHIVTFQDIPKEAITLKYEGTGSGDVEKWDKDSPNIVRESIKRVLKEESFLEYMSKMADEKRKQLNPYRGKEYNPENTGNFSDSKVKDIVWRAGEIKLDPRGGGIWFAENKEDVEKFAWSVRNEKREGKPYHINLQNPFYYEGFWYGYLNDADSQGREQLMDMLAADGHDGIIIDTDTWNDTGDEYSVTSKQYVVFNPENVKPA